MNTLDTFKSFNAGLAYLFSSTFLYLPVSGCQFDKIFTIKGRLHSAFPMCVSMSDKPFDAEACDIYGQASATNGLSGIETHIKNARSV
jgi:hypothetical protein